MQHNRAFFAHKEAKEKTYFLNFELALVCRFAIQQNINKDR